MTLRSARFAPLCALAAAFLLSCGGGKTKTDNATFEDVPDADMISPDQVEDPGPPDTQVPDVRDVQGTDAKDVAADDGVTIDTQPVDNGIDVVPDATGEVDVEAPLCPCDETIQNAQVCLLEGTTKTEFVSDICAKCAQCADGPGCKGCTGTRTDCTDLPTPNYFSWKGACSTCPCKLQDECDRLVFPDCGAVCGEKDGVLKNYANLCEMKADFGCYPDYDENLMNFGECVKPVCEDCLDQAVNAVCGSDGKTYDNQCSLTNCPETAGVTRACLGACVGSDFCPSCDSTCAPVCGDDGVTYMNECAATTCGTKDKLVDYAGACCPECAGEPTDEVCGTDGKAYPNLCTALCKGATPCGELGPTVCGQDGNDYPNTCWATCKAGGILHTGDCTRVCEQCPTTYSPVCGADAAGHARTYQSQCFETCLGGTGGTSGVCADCTTLCQNASPQTVCGGDGITYPNACLPQKCMLVTYTSGACP